MRLNRLLPAALLCTLLAAPPALADSGVMTVNGTELPYVSEGEGRPVVFVHGAISDSRAWEPLKADIAEHRRYVAYDQRYFGTAAWADDAAHFSTDTHVADLIAFVEALDAGPVDLVTWSYSGSVGTKAALRRPDLFQSLVHYEPSVGSLLDQLPGGASAQRELNRHFGPALAALENGAEEDAALRFLEAVFRMPADSAQDEPAPWPTMWRDNGRTVGPFLAIDRGAPVTCADLERLTVPTLVVQGAETFTRYSMIAEFLARCQPNAILITMDGVNHDGPYRKPRDFARFITHFIALHE